MVNRNFKRERERERDLDRLRVVLVWSSKIQRQWRIERRHCTFGNMVWHFGFLSGEISIF